MAVEVQATRQRIIRRPRLTSMLDESTAKVRMLIAPAGYGKTTLARQWLGEPERRGVWYRGGPASADVAALAAGIAEAASELIPDAGKRMRDRLRATGHPEEDVDILAELFAEDVQQWPEDTWLAIDDYHFAMESVASEHFVDLLTHQTPMQLLLTSRRRPSWASARRILYGELLEIERRHLAMEDAEAREVLGRRRSGEVGELLSRARGWPAVLGLAAMTKNLALPDEDLPVTLHGYFAEEVLHAVQPAITEALSTLALAPSITPQLAASILRVEAAPVLETGVRLGVLSEHAPGSFLMHPLLREFFRNSLSDEVRKADAASAIGEFFLANEEWDHAFEVATGASANKLLGRTLEWGLDPMLKKGRLATVQRWVNVGLSLNVDLAIVDLADAELAFRQAEHDRAYVLASQAATRLTEPLLASRAHIRAGHSGLLSSRELDALEHFRSAVALAPDWESRREALVGLYFAASELGASDAVQSIDELEAAEEYTPDGILRREVMRLIHATRTGGAVSDAVDAALPKLHLIDRATEPLGITGFLHALTTSLNLAARYEEALDLADRQRRLASKYRLHFPVAHAYLNEAISQAGLGNFASSARALRRVEEEIPPTGDAYLAATVRVIRTRALTAQQRFDEAVLLTEDDGAGITSPPLRAEYLASRALALACRGDASGAVAAVKRATNIFPSSVDVHVLSPCVDAVIALREADDAAQERAASRAWRAAVGTSSFDSFVCAYRASPQLLELLVRDAGVRSELGRLLSRARDHELARRLQIAKIPSRLDVPASLTNREAEVVRHLEQGASNREIARRLFISESTVKAHLRHIYEKLGVKTRSELLARSMRR